MKKEGIDLATPGVMVKASILRVILQLMYMLWMPKRDISICGIINKIKELSIDLSDPKVSPRERGVNQPWKTRKRLVG